MSQGSTAYLTGKCEVLDCEATGGKAVVARDAIELGDLIGVWSGRIVTAGELDALPPAIKRHTVQVEEGLYLASLSPGEPPDFINHSCEPNAGLRGQIAIVAMRRILPGEEVTIDYAMCDGTAYDEFECKCGAASCRGRVTGEDWRNPVLWERYAGYFSPYLQRRIQALRRAWETGIEMPAAQGLEHILAPTPNSADLTEHGYDAHRHLSGSEPHSRARGVRRGAADAWPPHLEHGPEI